MLTDVLHHSRLTGYRFPQGPLKVGQALTLSLVASDAYEGASAILRLWMQGAEQRIPMNRLALEESVRFTATVQMPLEPGLCWYFFILAQPDGGVQYYGGESGEGALYPHEPPGYQVTVYDGSFTTPRWFRESILYQIFPDRFRRGGNAEGGVQYHRDMGREIRVHDDWYEAPYYRPAVGAKFYAPNDFYLGDLEGIAQSVQYFKDLGISCLYLNPVFESGSNHRYDTADYRRIDPILGDNEGFRKLLALLKENGIRVMLDGVFSHTGADSLYFNKYGHYPELGAYQSEQSPYRSWYDFHPHKKLEYRTWWGFPELPEVNEMDPGYLDFVMDGEDSLLRYWAGHGVTNWRLDVADELPDAFIIRMRERLKQLDPESVLLGEVWEDASNKEAYGQRRAYVLGHALDSVMNYPFQKAVMAYFLGDDDAYALNGRLQTLRERYPKPFYYAAMNLLSTHDSVRALTALGGAPDRDMLGREEQAVYKPSAEAEAAAKRRLIAATALQMALPGVPSIYYGDEAGLMGMADPFNRAAYPWDREDRELLSAFQALASVRSQSPALKAGYCRMGACSLDVFAVLRYTAANQDAFMNEAEEDAALCLVNRAKLPMHVRLRVTDLQEGPDADKPVLLTGIWVERRTGRRVACIQDEFETVVPAMGGLLFRRQG